MTYQYATLPNGIRIIHRQTGGNVAHCGVAINAGARDELPEENGIAHFIEHILFKGTKSRKAYHILSRMENVGGDLNAYTAKEETFIYASFMSRYYERSIELFADILFNSTLPEKEIQKEKDVVLDEINSYKDAPAELVFDEFETLLYKGHPIGGSILGSPDTVNSLTRSDMLRFIKRHYTPDKMVISSIGNIQMEKLVALAARYFGELLPATNGASIRLPFNTYMPSQLTESKSSFQVHCVLGNIAYDLKNEKRSALALLTNMLGGPGMNSRLNLNIRERYGYCYNIEAHYQPFSDTGYFNIYIGADNGYLDKSIQLIYKELKTLREKPLGALQLQRAKQQIIGQIAISLESKLNEMLSAGKSHLFFDDVETFENIITKVEAITAKDLQEVANEIFVPDQFSMLTYIPSDK
jgi:predicted Zn-dependent peptidase